MSSCVWAKKHINKPVKTGSHESLALSHLHLIYSPWLRVTYLGFTFLGKVILDIEGAGGISKRCIDLADTSLPPRIHRMNTTLRLTQEEGGLHETIGEIPYLSVHSSPHKVTGQGAAKIDRNSAVFNYQICTYSNAIHFVWRWRS